MDNNNFNAQEMQAPVEGTPVYNTAPVENAYEAVAGVPVYGEEAVKEKNPESGKSTAAMILGIISLFLCLGPVSFICGVIATILGSIAWKRSEKTVGKGGMIMGIISIVLWILLILVIVILSIVVAGGIASAPIWMTEILMNILPSPSDMQMY